MKNELTITIIVIIVAFIATAIVILPMYSSQRERTQREQVTTLQTNGLKVVNADYHIQSYDGTKFIVIDNLHDFIIQAKSSNVSTVYYGQLYRSDIFQSAYWYRFDVKTIIVGEF